MKKILSILLAIILIFGTMSSGFAGTGGDVIVSDEDVALKATGSMPDSSAGIRFDVTGNYTYTGTNYDFYLTIPQGKTQLKVTIVGYPEEPGATPASVDYLLENEDGNDNDKDDDYTGNVQQVHEFFIDLGEVCDSDDPTLDLDVKWYPPSGSSQLVMHGTLHFECPPSSYDLDVSVEGEGTTTPVVGTHSYDPGTVVDLTASPASGWCFLEWTGDPVADPTDPTTTIEMTTDASVTAVFERCEYDLLVDHTGSGSTDPDGTSSRDFEDVVNLTATPSTGWNFVNWTGDSVADANDPTTTVEILGTTHVTANFERNEYNLNVSHTGSGSTIPDGDSSHDYEDVVGLTATATQGWYFDGWTGPVVDANNPTTTVQIMSNTTVAAVFLPVPPGDVTLTMAVDGQGSTVPPVGDHIVTEGSVVDLSASPAIGWEFVRWDGPVASSGSSETSIVMTTDATVTAVFELIDYTLTVTHAGQGTTVPSGASTRHYGDIVPLSADPADGWMFTGWTGPVASSGSMDTTVLILGDTEVRATFRPLPPGTVMLNVLHIGEGTTVPSGASVRDEDEIVVLSATPASGWEFIRWDGPVASSGASETTVTMTTNATVTAIFEPVQVEMVYLYIDSSGPGHTVPTEGMHAYPIGTTASLEVVPDGFAAYFDYWAGTDGSLVYYDDGYKIDMDGDREIIAVFGTEMEMVTLTIDIDGGGEVDTSEGMVTSSRTFTVTYGSTVYMIPDSDSGWYFDDWDGADQSDVYNEGSGEYSIYMDEDKEIEADFNKRSSPGPIIIRHRLKISIEGNGTVDPFVGSQTYMPGTDVSIAADPASGWSFEGWFGPDGGDVIDGVIDMDDDKTIIAKFVQAPTPPPIEPPEIIIPLTETPLGDGDLPDTGQAFPIDSLGIGFMLMMVGTLTRKKDE